MRTPVKERFLAKFDVAENGCWLWTAALDTNGYGKLGDGRKGWERAHRVAFRLYRGPIPKGCELHHTCEVKRCVNPFHLLPVTCKEHRAFTGITGAALDNALKTHCKRGHLLDGENVYLAAGRRSCRACRSQYQKDRLASRTPEEIERARAYSTDWARRKRAEKRAS